MKSALVGLGIGIALVGLVFSLAHRSAQELHRYRSDDPTVWEDEVRALERASAEGASLERPVVFLGSSGIRAWETIDEDLAPLPALRHGFGGAKTTDILHYLRRLTVPFAPRAVVLYTGGNDLFERAGNEASELADVVGRCRAIAQQLREMMADTPVYFLALRPPIRDSAGEDPFSQLNELLRGLADEQAGVEFIELNDRLYGTNRQLLREYLSDDRVHLTREGYREWSDPIRERLLRDLGSAG